MTATRLLKAATLVLLAAAWLVAAALLWRTKVPAPLHLPKLDAAAYFSAAQRHRAEHFGSVSSLLYVAGLAVTFAVLVAFALLARRLVRGFALGQIGAGVMIAVAVSLAVVVATLPIGLVGLWWDRRYDISHEGYLEFVAGQWSSVISQTATAAVVVPVVMLLARRFPRHWWALVTPLFVVVGAVFVVVGALLAPVGLHPIRGPVAADVRRLAVKEGVPHTKVRVDEVSDRTNAINGEATGVGPTSVVILWDTLFRSHLSTDAVDFVAAHELGHVARRHILKGLAWGLLFVVPLTFLLAQATRLRGGLDRAEVVPFAMLATFVLSLLAAPLENVVSRRYEAEADWMALQTTRDPAAGREAFRSFTRIDLAEPNPSLWEYVLLENHPTVMQRLAMTRAWERERGR